MEQVDFTIIGAGVIGLAIAQQLSANHPGCDLVVLEQHQRYGQETSSRNSEVIHSGIYYPATSLKSRLCLEGNHLLYEFCHCHQIKQRRLGKLIVAANRAERRALAELHRLGSTRGLELKWLEQQDLPAVEPQLRAEAALLVAATGIIDSEGYLAALYRLACDQGAIFLFNRPVNLIELGPAGWLIQAGTESFLTRVLINAAGLAADRIAAAAGIDLDSASYRLHYCKGEYYRLNKALPVQHLIYPPPQVTDLGIHLTPDLSGAQRLGPNAYYVQQLDYGIDASRKAQFYEAARRYLPSLDPAELQPDFAGIRPKLQGPQDPFRDFIISEESARGLPGLINLIGIESPGLTASLAIAAYVANLVHPLVK